MEKSSGVEREVFIKSWQGCLVKKCGHCYSVVLHVMFFCSQRNYVRKLSAFLIVFGGVLRLQSLKEFDGWHGMD